ncbi:MAG TPA: hypothetical protein PKG48_13640, partial [Bacteroidales bacterium]|nr:hypothetical protein [Bacteroidales bacterium]
MTYQITYNETNSFLIYRSAVVLKDPNDPTHYTANKRPRFTIEIKDHATGALLDPLCGFYDLYPGDGVTAWNTQGSWVWKDWSTIGVDISSLAGVVPGQLLDVVFTVHGCSFQAHTGYAYISATCGSMNITNSGCQNSGTVTMTAPPGFSSYQWYGPICKAPNPPCPYPAPLFYTGNPCMVTTAQGALTGNQFDLILTALNGCTVKHVMQTISFTMVNPGFESFVNCIHNPSMFVDTSSTTNPAQPIKKRRWKFDTDSAWTALTLNDTIYHTYHVLGQHIVSMETQSQDSCPGALTDTIWVGPPPSITDYIPGDTLCSQDSVKYTMTFSEVGANAQWTSTVSSGTATIVHIP